MSAFFTMLTVCSSCLLWDLQVKGNVSVIGLVRNKASIGIFFPSRLAAASGPTVAAQQGYAGIDQPAQLRRYSDGDAVTNAVCANKLLQVDASGCCSSKCHATLPLPARNQPH
jgi:hypothetical protein